MPNNSRARKGFSPFPKYLQLREILRKRMVSDYEVGQRLPSEQALREEFGLSRETVREALRGLELEGLIERHRAQGTFLIRKPDGVDERLTGLTEDFSALHLNTHAKVLHAGPVAATTDQALFAPLGTTVFLVSRLRYFNGSPLALHDAYFSVEIGEQISRLDLRNTSLVRELEETLGLACFEEREHIEAVCANPAQAEALHIEPGAALLVLTRYFVTAGRAPLVLFRSYYRADRYYYTLNLSERRAAPPAR